MSFENDTSDNSLVVEEKRSTTATITAATSKSIVDNYSNIEKIRSNKMAYLKLNHFAQQPDWLRDNHFLHNNHRAPTESYLMCLKSCFMLHTETMNIW